MTDLALKVSMVGAQGVGKTSLVEQFVYSIFSDRYHSTVGVKIDQKTVRVGERDVVLVLWDIAGEDGFFELPLTYVRGSAAYVVVIDGTRPETCRAVGPILDRIEGAYGPAPFVLVLNKADLEEDWAVGEAEVRAVLGERVPLIVRASAKTGDGVEEAFRLLAEGLVAGIGPGEGSTDR